MKKITKLLFFISALLLSLPTFGALAKPFKHTFSTVKGWDIRNGNVYHIEGDTVVITAGVPLGISGKTNMIRVVEV